MPRGTKTRLTVVSEVNITLDELYFIQSALHETYDDPLRPWAARLADRLLGLWSYWSEKTDDTAGFTLRIKR